LQEISYKKELDFDHDHLSKNYRFMMLNLIEDEGKKDQLTFYLEIILNEWEQIAEERDIEFLRNLHEILEKKREKLINERIFIKTNRFLSEYIENSILEGALAPTFEYFVENLRRSLLGVNHYLTKIFEEVKITPYIMKLFFRFFKDYMLYFFINLDEKSSDKKFLNKLIKCLKLVDSPLSLDVLKNIYSLSPNFLKIKVLRVMQSISDYDENFLMPILKKSNFNLKKEALVILMKDQSSLQKAMKKLFSINSPFGIRNKILRANIRIIEDKDLVETKEYLIPLSHKRHFWNRKLREKAKKVLEKWDAR
jgi:hypothetical protein